MHHLDAPWRPADIEQREGRIRRQGNGNATVRILRYVTEGSFDAYSWQLLETKAKFIAQVMTGHSTARRIEDLDSPALTYAEVKAIASGNPLVIEKAKVDSEVMRLSRLRAEHQESQYSGRNRMRMHENDVTRLERHAANMEEDLKIRRDTSGEKFEMTVDGQKFTERAKAGAALIYAVEDHRTDHLLGRPQTATLGEVGGFKIEFRSTNADKVNLRGTMEYSANVSPSPVGFVSSLEHAARGIDEQLGRCREDLARAKANLSELSALSGKMFEHEERYRELIGRQAELVTKLDLTKNQASSQQAAEPTDEVATTPDEPASPREQPEAVESVETLAKKIPAELMTPKEYRAAGLGPANDAVVLGALRAGKPVSALAVDEYNLKHALPRGYIRDGDRFVAAAKDGRSLQDADSSTEGEGRFFRFRGRDQFGARRQHPASRCDFPVCSYYELSSNAPCLPPPASIMVGGVHPLAVNKKQAGIALGSVKTLQRLLWCARHLPGDPWVKIVREGGPGTECLIDTASIESAYARIYRGETPPLLPSERKPLLDKS